MITKVDPKWIQGTMYDLVLTKSKIRHIINLVITKLSKGMII